MELLREEKEDLAENAWEALGYALSVTKRRNQTAKKAFVAYITYSQDRIDFIRAQSRERMEFQRDQENEEARELRRE